MGQIYLALYQKQHWSRSLLPSLARYMRSHTDHYIHTISGENELELLSKPYNQPAGFIGVFNESKQDLVEILKDKGIPAVNYSGRAIVEGVCTVTHDNVAIGRMAGEHLSSFGRRTFAFLGLGDDLLTQQRLQGFRESLGAKGFAVDAVFLSAETVYKENWLSALTHPAAVFCASDPIARKLCVVADSMGIAVPRDLMVLGVDDDPLECEVTRIPLSSITPDYDRLGFAIGARLHRLIEGKHPEHHLCTVPPSHVEIRLSTDYLGNEDELIRKAIHCIRMPRDESLTVATLAEQLHVSRRVLEKRFRNQLGHSVHDAIHQHRMERARRLLETTNLEVHQISERIGLADSKRFIRLFKQSFGKTPRAYRHSLNSQ